MNWRKDVEVYVEVLASLGVVNVLYPPSFYEPLWKIDEV